MASLTSAASDSRMKKSFQKPLLLKDYLLDDLNSCSSNGFRSYPRRQCCSTVRFLLEIDLSPSKNKQLLKSRSKTASSMTMSVLQKASEAVINAVKNLKFAGVRSPTRSFSRKFLRRSFWKKTNHKEIERWKSFRELIEDKSKTLDISPATATTDSNSSGGESKSNSWSDSDFTASDYLQCSSANSEINLCENDDVVESKRRLPDEVSRGVGVTDGEGTMDATTNSSVENTKKEWPNEEKEQLSPVSVLDVSFDDDVSSPFQRRLIHMEGTKQKLMNKLRRFESLAQLEPVDLEKRIALSEFDQESIESPLQPCSVSSQENITWDKEEDECKTEQKVMEFLEQMKEIIPPVSFIFNADNLLLDFFGERIIEGYTSDYELLDVAKDWMNGQPRELLLGWEVQKNREAYIIDMEKGGKWRDLDEEKEELALELEDEVFTSLMKELLLDLFTYHLS